LKKPCIWTWWKYGSWPRYAYAYVLFAPHLIFFFKSIQVHTCAVIYVISLRHFNVCITWTKYLNTTITRHKQVMTIILIRNMICQGRNWPYQYCLHDVINAHHIVNNRSECHTEKKMETRGFVIERTQPKYGRVRWMGWGVTVVWNNNPTVTLHSTVEKRNKYTKKTVATTRIHLLTSFPWTWCVIIGLPSHSLTTLHRSSPFTYKQKANLELKHNHIQIGSSRPK